MMNQVLDQKSIKEISEILREKLSAKNVSYTDVLVDAKGVGHIRFVAYDAAGFKTHEILVDSEKNYKIEKL